MHRVLSKWINAQASSLFPRECAWWIKHLWIKTYWFNYKYESTRLRLRFCPPGYTSISLFPFFPFAIFKKKWFDYYRHTFRKGSQRIYCIMVILKWWSDMLVTDSRILGLWKQVQSLSLWAMTERERERKEKYNLFFNRIENTAKGESQHGEHLNLKLLLVAPCQLTTVWIHAFFMNSESWSALSNQKPSWHAQKQKACKRIVTSSETLSQLRMRLKPLRDTGLLSVWKWYLKGEIKYSPERNLGR